MSRFHDAVNEQIVMKLLEDLHAEGNTIVMVTHDPTIARAADRTITLEHGRKPTAKIAPSPRCQPPGPAS